MLKSSLIEFSIYIFSINSSILIEYSLDILSKYKVYTFENQVQPQLILKIYVIFSYFVDLF